MMCEIECRVQLFIVASIDRVVKNCRFLWKASSHGYNDEVQKLVSYFGVVTSLCSA